MQIYTNEGSFLVSKVLFYVYFEIKKKLALRAFLEQNYHYLQPIII